MIEIVGVGKTYGDLVALKDITLTVEDGMLLSVIGPSGCGKTTLLRVIAGLTKPTEGEVRMDGQKVEGPSPERGFVFQEYGLFPWRTVEGNIEFGLEVRGLARGERERITGRCIEQVGLQGFERYYPEALSGGMKQRVGIARALANNPRVILMDEPFGALDAQTRKQMQSELLRIWAEERKTIAYVTHNVEEAVTMGDRVVVMSSRPGRILKVIEVDWPRPRTTSCPEVDRLKSTILAYLGVEDQ